MTDVESIEERSGRHRLHVFYPLLHWGTFAAFFCDDATELAGRAPEVLAFLLRAAPDFPRGSPACIAVLWAAWKRADRRRGRRALSGHATNVQNEQTQDRDAAQGTTRVGLPPPGPSGGAQGDPAGGGNPIAKQEVNHATLGGFDTSLISIQLPIKDKGGEVIGYRNSPEHANYFQTAKMAEDKDTAVANRQPSNAMTQEGAIPKLMEAQKKAREGGSNPRYQALRSKFEHEVGLLAAESPQALGAMKTMCAKSMDMLGIIGKTAGSLAGDPSSGYGGAVGFGDGDGRRKLPNGDEVELFTDEASAERATAELHRLLGSIEPNPRPTHAETSSGSFLGGLNGTSWPGRSRRGAAAILRT